MIWIKWAVFFVASFFTFAAQNLTMMKKNGSLRALFALLFVFSTILCLAQPPGGRPPGGGGGRHPGGRPPYGGDRQWGQTESNMPAVKPKKKVRRNLTPHTGDDSQTALWLAMMAIAAAGMAGAETYRRKRGRR